MQIEETREGSNHPENTQEAEKKKSKVPNLRIGAVCAVISALFLFISLILSALLNFNAFGRPRETDDSDGLSPANLEAIWEYNRKIFPINRANTFFTAVVRFF